jgi:hypothetical protein
MKKDEFRFSIIVLLFAIASFVFIFARVLYGKVQNDMSGFIGSALCAFFTLVLAYIALRQLNRIHSTSNAELIHKLKTDFFRPETRILTHLVEHEYLLFIDPETIQTASPYKEAYFEVDMDKIGKTNLPQEIRDDLSKKKYYSTYEMDDLLLGHLEDIGLFWDSGALEIGVVYEEFDYYLAIAYDNPAIKDYIKFARKDGADIYDKFEKVYNGSKSYKKKKIRTARMTATVHNSKSQ